MNQFKKYHSTPTMDVIQNLICKTVKKKNLPTGNFVNNYHKSSNHEILFTKIPRLIQNTCKKIKMKDLHSKLVIKSTSFDATLRPLYHPTM